MQIDDFVAILFILTPSGKAIRNRTRHGNTQGITDTDQALIQPSIIIIEL